MKEKPGFHLLIIEREDVENVDSYSRIPEGFQDRILPYVLQLANDPEFQVIITATIKRVRESDSPSAIEKYLADMKERFMGMKMEDKTGGQKSTGCEKIKEWYPAGAIQPAVDVVWKGFTNNPQQ